MTVPDGLMIAGFASLAGYSAWVSRRVTNSYFEHVASQSERLVRLEGAAEVQVSAQAAHDRSCAISTETICASLKEILKTLRRQNKEGRKVV